MPYPSGTAREARHSRDDDHETPDGETEPNRAHIRICRNSSGRSRRPYHESGLWPTLFVMIRDPSGGRSCRRSQRRTGSGTSSTAGSGDCGGPACHGAAESLPGARPATLDFAPATLAVVSSHVSQIGIDQLKYINKFTFYCSRRDDRLPGPGWSHLRPNPYLLSVFICVHLWLIPYSSVAPLRHPRERVPGPSGRVGVDPELSEVLADPGDRLVEPLVERVARLPAPELAGQGGAGEQAADLAGGGADAVGSVSTRIGRPSRAPIRSTSSPIVRSSPRPMLTDPAERGVAAGDRDEARRPCP